MRHFVTVSSLRTNSIDLGYIVAVSQSTILVGEIESMPIHDWSRVNAGLFHHFHQRWAGDLCDSLNKARLPKGYYALVEQRSAGFVPDVITLESPNKPRPQIDKANGVAVAEAPPKTRFVFQSNDEDVYALIADRVAIRNASGTIVAVIEIVSPGNKSGAASLRSFVEKTLDLLGKGVHLLIVDLFPPGPRDPQGIHKTIWDELREEPFELPKDKPLTLVSYSAEIPFTAYVEPVAVGDRLAEMPIFLTPKTYISAPLEESYQTTWDNCPETMREIVESAQV